NIDQQTLAARAGISVGALKNLENGRGSTIRTLVAVLKALDRADWLSTIAPVASINPLTHTESATPRQRATSARFAQR
ncbi:MAG TPA: helix-turn-helix transcriptional regulator, partial [Steroidobacteraceae bacterium]|nr:helix-turn-helix transcriptional regulator [Steroidobacteraceae bacterium]